ncbi:hypothetical protein ABG067_002332 [Albugo candida]
MEGRQFHMFVIGALLVMILGTNGGSNVIQDNAFEDEAIRNLPVKSVENRADFVEQEQQSKHHQHHPDEKIELTRYALSVWLEAVMATVIIGSVPIAFLIFIPTGIGSRLEQKNSLRAFLGFTAGGLLGDAFLHLMPHSMSIHTHHDESFSDHGTSLNYKHSHTLSDLRAWLWTIAGIVGFFVLDKVHSHTLSDLRAWLWTIAGIVGFFVLDKVVRLKHGSHSHSVIDSVSVNKPDHTEKLSGTTPPLSSVTRRLSKCKADINVEVNNLNQSARMEPNTRNIAASGYLNLVADFSHNFTDGLAIGATFLRGSGWQTTIAILLHELPHELGDFAILIQSGFKRREAIYLQVLTALGAMIGTVLGLLIESAGDTDSAWISPFTAGGFIYIACSSILPQLLEDCSIWQTVKEVFAFIAGVLLMIGITFLE